MKYALLLVLLGLFTSNCSSKRSIAPIKVKPVQQIESSVPKDNIESFTGDYINKEKGLEFTFTNNQGVLNGKLKSDPKIVRFKKVDKNVFRGIESPALVTFSMDENEKITGMTISIGGGELFRTTKVE